MSACVCGVCKCRPILCGGLRLWQLSSSTTLHFNFWDKNLWIWSSPIQWIKLIRKPQRYSCVSPALWLQLHATLWFLCGCWRISIRSSCLNSKHFTERGSYLPSSNTGNIFLTAIFIHILILYNLRTGTSICTLPFPFYCFETGSLLFCFESLQTPDHPGSL